MFFFCLQMYVQEVEDLKAECSRGYFIAKVFKYLSISIHSWTLFEAQPTHLCLDLIDEGLALPT